MDANMIAYISNSIMNDNMSTNVYFNKINYSLLRKKSCLATVAKAYKILIGSSLEDVHYVIENVHTEFHAFITL